MHSIQIQRYHLKIAYISSFTLYTSPLCGWIFLFQSFRGFSMNQFVNHSVGPSVSVSQWYDRVSIGLNSAMRPCIEILACIVVWQFDWLFVNLPVSLFPTLSLASLLWTVRPCFYANIFYKLWYETFGIFFHENLCNFSQGCGSRSVFFFLLEGRIRIQVNSTQFLKHTLNFCGSKLILMTFIPKEKKLRIIFMR